MSKIFKLKDLSKTELISLIKSNDFGRQHNGTVDLPAEDQPCECLTCNHIPVGFTNIGGDTVKVYGYQCDECADSLRQECCEHDFRTYIGLYGLFLRWVSVCRRCGYER